MSFCRNQIRVVTIFWGDLDGFCAFLRSLFGVDPSLEVIVGITPEWKGWDSGISTELTLDERLRVRFAFISNRGFGANMNELARLASEPLDENDYIIVANNDGYINLSVAVKDGWIRLTQAADSDVIVSRHPKTHDPKRYLQTRGNHQAISLSEDFFGVSVGLLRRREGKLYDERFFMYWEDVDLELSLGKEAATFESISLGFVHRSLGSLGIGNPQLVFHYHCGLRAFCLKHSRRFTPKSLFQVSYMVAFAVIRHLRPHKLNSLKALCRGLLGVPVRATMNTKSEGSDYENESSATSMHSETGTAEGPSGITLLIHTRNEATRIERCISSALPVAERIIVVDMESTDETCALAVAMGATVCSVRYTGTADSARSFGLSLVETEWVLALDADEVLPTQLCRTLTEVTRTGRYDAIDIPFRTFMFGREIVGSGWQNDSHVRLYKASVAHYSAAVHQFFHLTLDARVLKLPRIPENCILHFNYRSISEFLEKMNRYTDLEATKYDRAPTQRAILYSATRGFVAGFIRHKGYRDGEEGVVLAFLMFTYRFVAGFKARARFKETQANDSTDSLMARAEMNKISLAEVQIA